MQEPRVNTATDSDFESFIIALKSGNIETIDEYLDRFGSEIVNRLEVQQRQPPLYFAVNLPDDDTCELVIRKLTEKGANAKFKDQNSQTVMFYACRDGKAKCVDLLQQNGVPMDQEDAYGQIPLFYIASENQLHLLHKYSKLEHFNHTDRLVSQTPLYYAAKKGHLEMCKALMEKGCDPTHHDSHNKTAVEYARRARYHDVTEYLSGEVKKAKQKVKDQKEVGGPDSAHHSESKRRKKDAEMIPVATKSIYKIVFMNDKGETNDLTEEEVRSLFKKRPTEESYFANPDAIPRELLHEANLNDRWQKVAGRILNLCWKHKRGYWFHERVDPIKFEIMDYDEIITQPMDMGTIKKRLHNNYYSSHESFAEDMRLIWRNCYRYNGEGHEISDVAKEIENLFEESYESELKSQLKSVVLGHL